MLQFKLYLKFIMKYNVDALIAIHDFGVVEIVTSTKHCLYKVEFANKK